MISVIVRLCHSGWSAWLWDRPTPRSLHIDTKRQALHHHQWRVFSLQLKSFSTPLHYEPVTHVRDVTRDVTDEPAVSLEHLRMSIKADGASRSCSRSVLWCIQWCVVHGVNELTERDLSFKPYTHTSNLTKATILGRFDFQSHEPQQCSSAIIEIGFLFTWLSVWTPPPSPSSICSSTPGQVLHLAMRREEAEKDLEMSLRGPEQDRSL